VEVAIAKKQGRLRPPVSLRSFGSLDQSMLIVACPVCHDNTLWFSNFQFAIVTSGLQYLFLAFSYCRNLLLQEYAESAFTFANWKLVFQFSFVS
jgi:hypothetical protein